MAISKKMLEYIKYRKLDHGLPNDVYKKVKIKQKDKERLGLKFSIFIFKKFGSFNQRQLK